MVDVYCKTCRNVRTAVELGVVSSVTKADELFCGKHPPQTGAASVRCPDEPTACGRIESLQYVTYDDQPICLPGCNEGQSYRNMACWEPDDETVLFALSLKELEALHALFAWRSELLRNAPAGAVTRIDLGTIAERVIGGLGYLHERIVSRKPTTSADNPPKARP